MSRFGSGKGVEIIPYIAKLTDGGTRLAMIGARGWLSKESQIRVNVFGTVKHASADHTPPSKIISAIQLLIKRTPKFYLPYLKELQYFVGCVEHDLPPSSSGSDALKDLKTISLAYKNGIALRSEK